MMHAPKLRPLVNERGVTLLEIMFALGILMIGTYLVVEGVNQMEELNKDTKNLSATERQINIIVDNLRTGLASYQITYDPSPSVRDSMLEVSKLPMAWSAGVEMAVKDCDLAKGSCPVGRYGFVVQPIPQYRGLYQVTLRMTHADWKEPYRDFEFLVTMQ